MMNIKGFDRNLCCCGVQFEVGKEYKIDLKEGNHPKLRTDTVYHYGKSLEDVDMYYTSNSYYDNRFCEIDVLGEELGEDGIYGSPHIKIVREIVGKELDDLRNNGSHNIGVFNAGHVNVGDHNKGTGNVGNKNVSDDNCGNDNDRYRNVGNYNKGTGNVGNKNVGDDNCGNDNDGYRNVGNCNKGTGNVGNKNVGDDNHGSNNDGSRNHGDCNEGSCNVGRCNRGDNNVGHTNIGHYNVGSYNGGYGNKGDCNLGNKNVGSRNKGNYNTGHSNLGSGNRGSYNVGSRNYGCWNVGDGNLGNFNATDNCRGWFCTEEPKTVLFNRPTDIPYSEFVKTDACRLLELLIMQLNTSAVEVGEVNHREHLSRVSNRWWRQLADDDRAKIRALPNFDWEIFTEITGILED